MTATYPGFMHHTSVIGISGFSGSGKTTLICRIIPELKRQGLAVGVLKHVHHKLIVDVSGKDTDQFFRAGVDFVFAHDDAECFSRSRRNNNVFTDLIKKFPSALDLIIVEGHKNMEMPGIWLETRAGKKRGEIPVPGNRKIIFRDDLAYESKAINFIRKELKRSHLKRPVFSGLLVGGRSERMGRPKTLLQMKKQTLAERSFNLLRAVSLRTVLLGTGSLPESMAGVAQLSDVCGVEGPVSGLLSAFRWAPESAWLISSVDLPHMHKRAWEWLLNQRKPGVWAILPRIEGSRGVETTGALYEPMIFEHVESLVRCGNWKLQDIAEHPRVISPVIPKSLAPAWRNVNTPEEWKEALRLIEKEK